MASLTQSDIIILVSLVTFLTLLLLFLGAGQHIRQNKRRQEIIEKIKMAGITGSTFDKVTITRTDDKKGAVLSLVESIGRHIAPAKLSAQAPIRTKMLQAGIRRENAVSVYWGAKGLFSLILPAVFIAVRIPFLAMVDQPTTIAAGVLLALLGYYLPDIYLRTVVEKRKEKILAELPDVLDLLVVCTEAGMGLDAAIAKTADEMSLSGSTLSSELKLMNLEMRAGKSRQDALRDLAMRSGLDDMNSLTTLLIQTDKFGTSIAKTLRIFSDSFRNARYLKAEEFAAKLPIKLVIPLIAFIFPALFIVIVGPAAIAIYQNIILK
jgi:tight adherence protein C